MQVQDAIAEILKREGVETLIGYPVNPMFDAAAKANIRTIVVRQERIGVHMADSFSRMNSGKKIGVFTMQSGPGTENAFGAIAQAWSESVPLVVIAGGYARNQTNVFPYFSGLVNFQHITKSAEQVTDAAMLPNVMRRAFSTAKNGRPGPCFVEIPADIWTAEVAEPIDYEPVIMARSAPDPRDVEAAAQALVDAEHPLLYAGQGVHYAEAWGELKELAEILEAPVTTSLEGKSAFPEDHPLSLCSGGRSYPGPVRHALMEADVIFGVGASFTRTNYGIAFPKGPRYIHSTNDARDLNKDIRASHALIGDAQITLSQLTEAVSERLGGKARGLTEGIASRIRVQREEWMKQWLPKLTDTSAPISPYRVIWDLLHTVDVPNTVITHDAGSPRDQISPFWKATAPLTYLGWGKTTQLGYGLGLAMGAKVADPDKLCINYWGDAAIGMTGMDFETAVRERIPIMSILSNNFSMAIELKAMAVSTEKYRSTDISGNYAEFANALGGYGERVTDPSQIIPAIKRGIEKTKEGTPVLLEFITQKETEISSWPAPNPGW
jgi:acetolactate synthase-1/2/3 large subunit